MEGGGGGGGGSDMLSAPVVRSGTCDIQIDGKRGPGCHGRNWQRKPVVDGVLLGLILEVGMCGDQQKLAEPTNVDDAPASAHYSKCG